MRTNILAVQGKTPLSEADIMSSTAPDAIIVIDDGGDFMGYFSVRDYREATRRLEAHLLVLQDSQGLVRLLQRKKSRRRYRGGPPGLTFRKQ